MVNTLKCFEHTFIPLCMHACIHMCVYRISFLLPRFYCFVFEESGRKWNKNKTGSSLWVFYSLRLLQDHSQVQVIILIWAVVHFSWPTCVMFSVVLQLSVPPGVVWGHVEEHLCSKHLWMCDQGPCMKAFNSLAGGFYWECRKSGQIMLF